MIMPMLLHTFPCHAGSNVGVQMVKPWKRRSPRATMVTGKGPGGLKSSIPNRLADSAALFSKPGHPSPANGLVDSVTKEWTAWVEWLNVACSASFIWQLAYQFDITSSTLMRLESLKDATGQYHASAHDPFSESKFAET